MRPARARPLTSRTASAFGKRHVLALRTRNLPRPGPPPHARLAARCSASAGSPVLMPGIVVFAVAFGAAASAKGLSLLETVLMSAVVYAGVAQLVAMELWRPEWSWGAIAGLAVVTATVNARMVLQGASLQPWFAPYSKALNALASLLLHRRQLDDRHALPCRGRARSRRAGRGRAGAVAGLGRGHRAGLPARRAGGRSAGPTGSTSSCRSSSRR